MTDRRKFLKSIGTGICTFTIGTAHSQSQQIDNNRPFILKDLPDHYASGYSSIKIGMCQVYTEEWKIEDNIQRTLNALLNVYFTVILLMIHWANLNLSEKHFTILLNLWTANM